MARPQTIVFAVCCTDEGTQIVNTDDEEKAYEIITGSPYPDDPDEIDDTWEFLLVSLAPDEPFLIN